jgi:hypothetical protein
LNCAKTTGELNYEKQSVLVNTSKSVIINVEVCFPFGNKTLLEEVMKIVGAGILKTHE